MCGVLSTSNHASRHRTGGRLLRPAAPVGTEIVQSQWRSNTVVATAKQGVIIDDKRV